MRLSAKAKFSPTSRPFFSYPQAPGCMKLDLSTPKFMFESALGTFGHVVGKLVGAEVDAGDFPHHPGVEFLVRILGMHEFIDPLRVLDLLEMIIPFLIQ